MHIGEVAKRSRLRSKTIRYYEEIGLIKPDRAANGYRDYCNNDLHRLTFLQRARSLGFSLSEVRALLSLYNDQERESADVKAIALAKIREMDQKIDQLKSLKRVLSELSDKCLGDNRPDCPILKDLSGALKNSD